MKRYRVTIYLSEVYEVEAENEIEAEDKALDKLKNLRIIPIPDDCETECLDEEDEDE